MAINFIQTGDELPLHSATSFDDDSAEGFWGGVFQCGVQLVLAAALAATAGQTAQAQVQWTYDIQDPAGNLHQPANEDYWQNPTPPVPLAFYQQLPLGDVEQVPAGGLFGQFDEDFQWSQLLPPPLPLTLGTVYLPDPDEIPAAQLHGQPDEDFWANPTPPVPLTFLIPQQWIADEQSPVLFGNPFEDDSWTAPPPVPATFWQSLPYWFDDGATVTPQVGSIVDEDYWQNPVAPVSWSSTVIFTDDDVPVLFGNPFEDDSWQNPTPPLAATYWQASPYWFDDQVIVPQPVAFQPDEDFWQNPTPPLAASYWHYASLWLWQDDSNLLVTPFVPPPTVGRSARLRMAFPAFR